jgi:hypothetical protein
MKPTFKAPGTKRLKLRCDEPVSKLKIAFKFNLRCYTVEVLASDAGASGPAVTVDGKVGRCMLTLSNPRLQRLELNSLKVRYDEPLSNSAFKFNLRRYSKEYNGGSPAPAPATPPDTSDGDKPRLLSFLTR